MDKLNFNNLDLNDLYLFVQVIDAKSFSAASRILDIPKATISRRIARLEKLIGKALIQRNTRQFEMTNIGEQFYYYCADLVEQTQQIQDFINGQDEFSGTVQFSCPREMMDFHFSEPLMEFIKSYPKINLHIKNTNRSVDLVQERFDFAIRGRQMPMKDSETIIRPLFTAKQHLVASPKLMKTAVQDLEDLHNYPSLSWQSQRHVWTFNHAEKSKRHIAYTPYIQSDNFFFLRQAALDGLGLVVLPDTLAKEHFANGSLISAIPPEWQLDDYMVHIAYSSRKAPLPSAKLLINFLVERLADC